jgi:hypothetical protein
MKRDKEHRSKLAPRYEPTVFLGCNHNSAYRVGVWRGDAFSALENKTVKFVKNDAVLVRDVRELKPGGPLSVMGCLDLPCDSVMPEDEVVSRGFGHSAGVDSATDGSPFSEGPTLSGGPETTSNSNTNVGVKDVSFFDDPATAGDGKMHGNNSKVTSSGSAHRPLSLPNLSS